MRKSENFVRLIAVASALALAGCATSQYQKLEGAYGLKVHKASDSKGEEANPQIELIYSDAEKKKQVVWPRMVNVVINGETAVFIGESGKDSDGEGARLYAFNPPGPAVDITRPVLEFAVREKVKGIRPSPRTPALGAMKKIEDGFEIEVGEPGWGTPFIDVKWTQLPDMMREGKASVGK
jgi:hypothetical protein